MNFLSSLVSDFPVGGLIGGAAGFLGNLAGGAANAALLQDVVLAGQAQMAQGAILQLSNIATNMVMAQMQSTATQQKTVMDAEAGIGQAYSNGAASLYGAVYAVNNKMGEVFSKAGGH